MKIDWSKAPEGATHYGPETDVYAASWFKKENGDWCSWLEHIDDRWEVDIDVPSSYEKAMVKRPDEWSGEGLPPVGTVCDALVCGGWKECLVIYHDPNNEDMAAVTYSGMLMWSSEFRPTKTPEQIAAEEREQAIREMKLIAGFTVGGGCIFSRLYDKGYRKIEGGEE